MEGLRIHDPNELCNVDFGSSLPGDTVISAAIGVTTKFDWSKHLASLYTASVSHHQSMESWYDERLHLTLDQFPEALQSATY